jgi:adenylate cyclase, class 2
LVRSQSLYPAELRARSTYRIIYNLAASKHQRRIIKVQMSAAPPYREVEIKLAYSGSPDAARLMLEHHGYLVVEPRVLEADQLFDRARELRDSDQLLRVRRTGDRAMVTYKGPGIRKRHKSREEIEFDISDAKAFTLVLSRLEYHPSFRYEKYRTKFAAAGEPGFITMDETPIGLFLELEGEPTWIDVTAARLGYSPEQYLTCSYASLYRKYRLVHPGESDDMTFPRSDLRRTSEKNT